MSTDLISLYMQDPSKLTVMLALCSVRILVVFAMLPLFASHLVPAMVRGGLAIAMAFPVTLGVVHHPLPFDFTMWSLASFLAKEGAVGLLIGLGFGAFFAGLQAVGEIIDHQTGLTFTQNIDPVHGNSVSLSAQYLERLLFAVLMVSGAMLVIVDTVYLSFEVWPLGQWAPIFDRAMLLNLVPQASKLFALSLLLAGPVVLALFIVDAGLGLLNRAAPQLNIFNITLSLKSLIGIAVLILALPMIVTRVIGAMHDVAGTLRLFLVGLH